MFRKILDDLGCPHDFGNLQIPRSKTMCLKQRNASEQHPGSRCLENATTQRTLRIIKIHQDSKVLSLLSPYYHHTYMYIYTITHIYIYCIYYVYNYILYIIFISTYIFSFRVNEYVGAHPRFQLGHGRELGAILQVCFLGR